MAKLKAVNNRVVVHVEEVKEHVTAGGIILSAEQVGPVKSGSVLAVGPQAEDSGISVGDTVAFYQGHGTAVKEVENYYTVESKDILYAIEDSED